MWLYVGLVLFCRAPGRVLVEVMLSPLEKGLLENLPLEDLRSEIDISRDTTGSSSKHARRVRVE